MKIIHFCGDSGVGKKTLLRNIWDIKAKMSTGPLSAPEQSLLEQLEIEGRFHIWGPFKCRNEWRKDKDVDSIWDLIKTDIEKNECQTLIHHWQSRTNRIFHRVYDLAPNIHQKAFLFWRHPSQHKKEFESRCKEVREKYEQCIKDGVDPASSKIEELNRQIGYYCDKDEKDRREKFANSLYPKLVNAEMSKMGY